LDGMSLELEVAGGRAALEDRGRGPAQDFIDRNAHLGDPGAAQALELLGVFHQRLEPATDGTAGGLGAGREQKHKEIEQLVVVERSARAAVLARLEPRRDDGGEDVVGQVRALLRDQAYAVRAQALRVFPRDDLR